MKISDVRKTSKSPLSAVQPRLDLCRLPPAAWAVVRRQRVGETQPSEAEVADAVVPRQTLRTKDQSNIL